MDHRLKEGKTNPLIIENAEDYDRLLDFIFVKRPFIPGPIKKVLIKEAIEHHQLNRKIFSQIHESADVPPLEKRLEGLPFPTMIIWGSEDNVLHVSGAKILESVMPNAKAEVIDSAGHAPMIERPKETAGLYIKFLGL